MGSSFEFSRSCKSKLSRGLPLFVAVAASILHGGLAAVVSVQPGGLQSALDKVKAGDTLRLAPGEYWETVTTKVEGRADAYITIEGESYGAVLKGDSSIDNDDRVMNIQHSYYRLDRFTIDGKHSDKNYVDKCLYVQQSRDNDKIAGEIEFNGHKFRSSINGLVLSNMDIMNCGGECVRMRYFITYSQVYNNRISNCGAHDYVMDGKSKNGEGIYLGTSSNQWEDGKNPSPEDESSYNHFFKNHFNTQGNEGIDIKEGSKFNIVEENYCTGQKDPESACLDARGDSNIFRFNTCENNKGAGIRIGGHKIDGHQFGQMNEVYDNLLENNDYAGIKITMEPQGAVCSNKIVGSKEAIKGSSFAEKLNPDDGCLAVANDSPTVIRTEEEDCDYCEEKKRLEKELKVAKKKCKESKAEAAVSQNMEDDKGFLRAGSKDSSDR
ncbi:unnamed protein product [Scytosiphon promiscuus]